ncbi:MAG: hypothetical protein ABGX43_06515 [Nitrospinaceae bacterium]
MKSNIAIKSNIWCDREYSDPNAIPYFIQSFLPGDFLVEILGTRDCRTLNRELTAIQREEYGQSRFFQNHGQSGIAFEGII